MFISLELFAFAGTSIIGAKIRTLIFFCSLVFINF